MTKDWRGFVTELLIILAVQLAVWSVIPAGLSCQYFY